MTDLDKENVTAVVLTLIAGIVLIIVALIKTLNDSCKPVEVNFFEGQRVEFVKTGEPVRVTGLYTRKQGTECARFLVRFSDGGEIMAYWSELKAL